MSAQLTDAKEHLVSAAKALGISGKVISILSEPKRVLEDDIPVKMEAGETRYFNASSRSKRNRR